MDSQIPPESEELQFIRNRNSGRVHIMPWIPGPGDDGCEHTPITSGEEFAEWAMEPGKMLCGVRLGVDPWGFAGMYVAEFADEDLCVRCVAALGDQSVRAFEHPLPGDDG